MNALDGVQSELLRLKWHVAMTSETKGAKLFGEVEIDGPYFGGHVLPANVKENRPDRRLAENRSGKRRIVIGIRQRKGRRLAFVSKHEPRASKLRSGLLTGLPPFTRRSLALACAA